MNQATITVTFYFYLRNEPIHQLKRKYVVKNWQDEADLKRLLDEIAAEMNYISGYGIKSIAVAAEHLKFTIDYGQKFLPYGRYNEEESVGFLESLRFEVGQLTGSRRKTIWFEIPRVHYMTGAINPIKKYDPDDRLFQIKAVAINGRKHIRRAKTIYNLSFDRDNPILLSFLHKIYEGAILFPDIKKEWLHSQQKSCHVNFISEWELPESQTTQYQWKKIEKREQAEKRTKKLLKKHGVGVDENKKREKPTQVYIIQQIGEHGFRDLYKIGISKSPQKRLQALKTSNPFELKIVHTFAADPAEEAEAQLHAKYEHIHQKGEWFKLSDEEITELTQITVFRDGKFLKDEK